jgi:hypothetical protein
MTFAARFAKKNSIIFRFKKLGNRNLELEQ